MKNEVNVFATLRSPNIQFRNVFTHVENVSVVILPIRVSLAPVGRVRIPHDTFIPAILGSVRVGEFENTRFQPLHVSSLITPASCAEVVEAN